MHLSFDNLDELKEFLAFIGEGSRTTYAIGEMSITTPAIFGTEPGMLVPSYAPIAPDEAQTPQQATQGVNNDSPTELHIPAEPAKRKRRTKAEMQADAERETGLQQPGTLPEGVGTEPGASTSETGGNAAVQAALAGNVVAATEALNATQIGDNPFANMSPAEIVATVDKEGQALNGNLEPQPRAVVPAVAKPETPEDIRVWIETTAIGKFNAITPVDHLNVAKAFIAAKGMPSYNESFGLVGLGNNIMGYTTEQRALHAAALDYLDWE